MKKIIFFLLFFYSQFSFNQSFEGTLTYIADIEVSEKFEKMGLTKESMIQKMVEEGTWTDTIRTSYKNGNYYTWKNSNPFTWLIYKSDKNRIYTMQEGEFSDICRVRDASKDYEIIEMGKVPLVSVLDTVAIVADVPCKIVRVKWKYGVYDYYYGDSNLNVDGSLFANHIYDGWASFLKISNSLPLKIVKKVSGMATVTLTMISAKNESIDDQLFDIPKLKSDKSLNSFTVPYEEKMRIIK